MAVDETIRLPVYGIVVTLAGEGSGTIASPELTDKSWPEGPFNTSSSDYSAAIDGILSMILATACAGLDITSPAYCEVIETAVEGVTNTYT